MNDARPRVTTDTVIRRIVTALVLLAGIVSVQFFTAPPFGDEARFLESTRALIPFNPARLRSFVEISSPTFFIAFSYVMQWTGLGLAAFRLIVFACLCVSVWQYQQLVDRVARKADASTRAGTVIVVLLMMFPYLIVGGVHFYTDIPAMMFGLLCYAAYLERRQASTIVWATLALHCRQFMIFVPIGLALALWWTAPSDRRQRRWSVLLVALPALTYVPYLALWRDVSPMRSVYPQLAPLPLVVPAHLSYMMASAGAYLLPLAVWIARQRWTPTKIGIAIGAAAWVLWFPPQPNLYFALLGRPIVTLGLVDSALDHVVHGTGRTMVYALGAAIAAALHVELFTRTPSSDSGLRWVLVCFWTMNLFTHLAWDKYLLPVLPFVYLAALAHPTLITPGGALRRAAPGRSSAGRS